MGYGGNRVTSITPHLWNFKFALVPFIFRIKYAFFLAFNHFRKFKSSHETCSLSAANQWHWNEVVGETVFVCFSLSFFYNLINSFLTTTWFAAKSGKTNFGVKKTQKLAIKWVVGKKYDSGKSLISFHRFSIFFSSLKWSKDMNFFWA